MRNSRVFISCGQRDDREKTIGKSVEDYFKSRRFETYFAERVHSSDALTENIFRFLRQSEYFVFIDFRREEINEKRFRGSLFVNQEIAIATFLKLQGIGFCEKGIKREGILTYHIYNEFPFKDGTEIVETLEEETKKWDLNSVNELKIIYNPRSISRDVRLAGDPMKRLSDWYHLEVRNRNKAEHAFLCSGYASRIRGLEGDQDLPLPTVELIWTSISETAVSILSDTVRELDAFFLIHKEDQIHFHQRPFTTSEPKYHLPLLVPGRYLMQYTVVSSNFDTASQDFILEHKGGSNGITFKPVG